SITANERERPTGGGWAGRFPAGRCLIENNPKKSPSTAVYFRFRIVSQYDNGSLLLGQGLRQMKYVEWAMISARDPGTAPGRKAGLPPASGCPCRLLAPGDPLRRAGTHGRAGRARDRRRSSQRATRAAASRFR